MLSNSTFFEFFCLCYSCLQPHYIDAFHWLHASIKASEMTCHSSDCSTTRWGWKLVNHQSIVSLFFHEVDQTMADGSFTEGQRQGHLSISHCKISQRLQVAGLRRFVISHDKTSYMRYLNGAQKALSCQGVFMFHQYLMSHHRKSLCIKINMIYFVWPV